MAKKSSNERGGKLRVMSLGGLQEIGKNMTVLEYGDDIIIIDCGMGFGLGCGCIRLDDFQTFYV